MQINWVFLMGGRLSSSEPGRRILLLQLLAFPAHFPHPADRQKKKNWVRHAGFSTTSARSDTYSHPRSTGRPPRGFWLTPGGLMATATRSPPGGREERRIFGGQGVGSSVPTFHPSLRWAYLRSCWKLCLSKHKNPRLCDH